MQDKATFNSDTLGAMIAEEYCQLSRIELGHRITSADKWLRAMSATDQDDFVNELGNQSRNSQPRSDQRSAAAVLIDRAVRINTDEARRVALRQRFANVVMKKGDN